MTPSSTPRVECPSCGRIVFTYRIARLEDYERTLSASRVIPTGPLHYCGHRDCEMQHTKIAEVK